MQDDYFELFHRKRRRAPKHFPGRTVIQTFTATEEMLEEVLQIVPFCQEHGGIWSPRLATVLLEAGSQIDSLWRFESKESSRPKRTGRNGGQMEWDIRDFFSFFGMDLVAKWVVFFGGERPLLIPPFSDWQGQANYKPLDWWKAYTALKHDRLGNQTCATLAAAVDAVAGLFLAIARSGYCDEYLMQANWVTCSTFGHDDDVKLDDFPAENYAVIETRLFSYSLGLWRGVEKVCSFWIDRNASERLRLWFADYCSEQYAARLKDAQQAGSPAS
jgi:hypothetical protein